MSPTRVCAILPSPSRVQRLLGLPDATRERRQERPGQLRHLGEHVVEVPAVDHEQAERRLGDDGCRARLAVEEAHLAEEVTRPQAHALSRSEERRVGKECRYRWST